jgi:hypothetical protein
VARGRDRLLDCAVVTRPRTALWWAAALLALAGLGLLYADALRTGFLNDDYLFLEEARTRPLGRSLVEMGALGNYYRPLTRQVYFAALTPLADGAPWVFHLVNGLAFAAILALLVDLLRAVLPVSGVFAGALYFATLPLQRVNLTWISCSQDLFALLFVLGALALFRRGHDRWACGAYLAALASKEVAFPLPAALAAWAWWLGDPGAGAAVRPAPRALARRLAPFALIGLAWLVVVAALRARHPVSAAVLHPTPSQFLAAWVHGVQSLLGLEHPPGFLSGLIGHPPALAPLAPLAALAWWLPESVPKARVPGDARPSRPVIAFALAWFTAFALPVGPVAHVWSGYYYSVAAVAGALLVGLACRRLDRWGWVALATVLLWWHAGSSATRSFAVADRPWGWTSHFTAFYFQRGAELSGTLQRELRAYEPAPPRGTRFYFATLPPWAGFQMGNGALIRTLYRDPSLAGYFYSQFSESTAAGHPCRFLHWDGVRFVPLYGGAREPWFQVGSDLLLFGRPAGAAHAFARGLEAGEGRADHLYWLGWAELWRGRRDEAEAAWQAFGARDDPAAYDANLLAARDALLAADTLAARRRLFEAIRAGIGRPEAHGALGELLEPRQLKYGLLELKVAAFLNPRDIRARHHLVRGLVEVRLDEAARAALAELAGVDPGWARDSTTAQAGRVLETRSGAGATVVEF